MQSDEKDKQVYEISGDKTRRQPNARLLPVWLYRACGQPHHVGDLFSESVSPLSGSADQPVDSATRRHFRPQLLFINCLICGGWYRLLCAVGHCMAVLNPASEYLRPENIANESTFQHVRVFSASIAAIRFTRKGSFSASMITLDPLL